MPLGHLPGSQWPWLWPPATPGAARASRQASWWASTGQGLDGHPALPPSSQHPALAPNTLPSHPTPPRHPAPPPHAPPPRGAPQSDTPRSWVRGQEKAAPRAHLGARRVGSLCVQPGAGVDLAGSSPAWLKIKEGGGWLPRLPVNQPGRQPGGCLGQPRGAGWAQAPVAGCGPPSPSSPASRTAPGAGGPAPSGRHLWEVGLTRGSLAVPAPAPCPSDPPVARGEPQVV